MARGDNSRVEGSPDRFTTFLDAARPNTPVRVVTQEERKNRTPSPSRRKQAGEKVNPMNHSTMNPMTTPPRSIENIGNGDDERASPFTRAAQLRLDKLKQMLESQ